MEYTLSITLFVCQLINTFLLISLTRTLQSKTWKKDNLEIWERFYFGEHKSCIHVRNCIWVLYMVNHDLRVASYELRVGSLKAWAEIQTCEFKSVNYEVKSKSYEFKPRVTSLNPRVTSSNPRIIKSVGTQVNSLKNLIS